MPRTALANDEPPERREHPDRPFLTVEEAAALLGISRTLAYALAREYLATHTTGLPCVRIGSRRIVIARQTLTRMANEGNTHDITDPKDAA